MYKLLIVDDSTIQIQSLICYLDWEKYGIGKIEIAYNGRQGLELCRSFEPDIIIADIAMPVMSGLEMIGNIEPAGKMPKVIYMSCYDDSKYIKKAMELGAASYILKPIDRNELSDAIKRVVNALDDTDERADLSEHKTKYIEALRENFLYHVVYSKNLDIEYYKNMFSKAEFGQYSLFSVVEMEIVYHESEDGSDMYSFMTAMKQELLVNGENIFVTDGEDKIIILLFGQNTDKKNFESEVQGLVARCVRCAREDHGMIIIAGISKVSTSFYDIPVLFMQAQNVLGNNLASDERVYSYNSFAMPDEYYNIEIIKSNIANIVRYPNESGKKEFINNFCIVPDNDDEQYAIEMRYVSFFAAVQLFLNEQRIPISGVFGQGRVTLNRSGAFESTEQLGQWIYNTISGITEYMNKYSSEKLEKTVSDMIEYINNNYSSISNVEQIASYCYVSASYARKIFKEKIGKTIYEYVMLIRIDKARQFLAHKDIPIYEIAERVGYKSRTNFVNAFKKYTGLLPSEFRNRLGIYTETN